MSLSYPPLIFPTSIPQLVDDFGRVEADAGSLLRDIDNERFNRAPAPGAWSAAQCLDHLAITVHTYVKAMNLGLDGAVPDDGSSLSVSPGMLSRWFIRQMEPPVKRRFKAPRLIVPPPRHDRDEAWRDFLAAGDTFRECVRRSERVDVNRVRFQNPLAPLRFSLATGLAVTVAHHRRHVWQMERALGHTG